MSYPSQTQPEITLYRGFPIEQGYVWSPFVNKLEARLRFAGISYKLDVGSPMKAPRGKIPYLGVSKPNYPLKTLSDTSIISAWLTEEGLAEDLNAEMAPAEKARDLAFRALLEDKLYYYMVSLVRKSLLSSSLS